MSFAAGHVRELEPWPGYYLTADGGLYLGTLHVHGALVCAVSAGPLEQV